MPWMSPPTLYKARQVPTKQPVCAICVDRTRGKTQKLQLTHRVSVWLCHDHAGPGFQTRRSGRDFVTTLAAVWKANDCLTSARSKALTAHLERLRAPRPPRPRPGSYAWPDLRRDLERAYAEGATPQQACRHENEQHGAGPARPPSRRTSSAGTPNAAGWSGRLDPGETGVQQRDGVGEALRARADARGGEPLRGEQLPRKRRDRIGVDGIDLGADAVEGEQLGVGQHGLPEPAGPVRGGLHGEHDPALQVLLGPLELGRVEAPLPHQLELIGDDADALGQIVLARAQVDADHARVRVLRRVRVDRVRHPPSLADLLEEPRRRGAPQHRVEQRGGEAAPVGARHAQAAERDVELLRILALEEGA